MAKINEPTPVKLFTAMISQDTSLFDELSEKLTAIYGPVDMESPIWPWDHTKYYEKEMGEDLKRKFIFFEKLVNPGIIADVKLKTDELEKQHLYEQGGRQINLDPGYLDEAKLVLASAKNFSHKIYLSHGIFGELTLFYADNNYQALPYTFSDYKSEKYLEVFRKARTLFRQQFR
jgi:hypothetical protein